MRLSVRARLACGFAVLLALMCVLVAIAVVSVNRLQEAQHEVAGSAMPYLQGLSDSALAAKSAANDERGYLMTGDQKYATEAVGRREARMAEATNHMLAATAGAVRTLAANSADLVTTAREMTATSDALAASAEVASAKAGHVSANAGDVSDGVHTVSVAAEEMTATINEIASSVSQAAGVSAEAVTSAEAAGAAVKQLDASSRQIGTVVQLITSIAEQTNLLALNATIEAARAGDAGKGFAVVAGEVKDLAQETAKATGEIANQVAAIQGDTQRAVDAIGRISEVIGSVSQYQNTIATAVEEQSATTNEMGRSISEIASRTGQITTGITDVAGTVGSTAAGIQASRRSAASLSTMAGELQELVARFRY
jgi:methyl-accepting chemotaxis protein